MNKEREVLAELVAVQDAMKYRSVLKRGEDNDIEELLRRNKAAWAAARSLLKTKQGESRDEIIEKCAKVCEAIAARATTGGGVIGSITCAEEIRALKSQQSDTGGKG